MKSKKLFLPCVILIVAVFAMAIYSVICSIAKKPTITEKEFPFSITYELNGETKTINEVFSVRYDRNDGYTDTKTRVYVGNIGDMGDDENSYTLREDENGRIVLLTKLYADYLMGDTKYDYFDNEPFEPQILYYDLDEIEYTDEETLLAQGVKLISFEYPTPIENSFVFSHISIFDNKVVIPSALISLLALILTVILVKKEQDFERKPMDIVSIIFNFILAFVVVPFFTFVALLMDITGDNDNIFSQLIYFVPALTVLGVAASIALRRKGYKKSALVAELVCPVVFVLMFIILGVLGLI